MIRILLYVLFCILAFTRIGLSQATGGDAPDNPGSEEGTGSADNSESDSTGDSADSSGGDSTDDSADSSEGDSEGAEDPYEDYYGIFSDEHIEKLKKAAKEEEQKCKDKGHKDCKCFPQLFAQGTFHQPTRANDAALGRTGARPGMAAFVPTLPGSPPDDISLDIDIGGVKLAPTTEAKKTRKG